MSYSRNFGIRSFENLVRDGRSRTPAGSSLVIGEPVLVDPATPGFMKAAGAGEAVTQNCGLVVFEHIQVKGVDPALTTTSDEPFNKVPGGSYAQIVHGQGAKVWFKNTASKTLYDGRTQAAGGLLADSVNLATLAPGDQLTPDGSGKYKVANGTSDGNWLTVESVNASTGVVEARFNF